MKISSTKKPIDMLIYIVVIASPIANIPQLLKIWNEQDASGVSAISWFAFAVGSLCWITYGISKKDRPIILMNIALLCIQTTIGFSALLFS